MYKIITGETLTAVCSSKQVIVHVSLHWKRWQLSSTATSISLNLHVFYSALKPVLNGHSQKDRKLVFKTDYRLMQVKSIAECSFCNTFNLH